MSFTIIVARRNQWENIMDSLDYREDEVTHKSKQHLKIENRHKEQRIEIRPPNNGLRAYKPDTVILKTDVTQKYYNEIIAPMKGFGAVIIDESKRT